MRRSYAPKLKTALALLLAALLWAPGAGASPLDRTFGGDGVVTASGFGTGPDESALAMVVQPDGKIVLGGFASETGGVRDFALARFRPNGSLDPSFGGDGKVVTPIAGFNEIRGLALQPDGKIVAVGRTPKPASSDFDWAIARYNANGTLDSSGDGTPGAFDDDGLLRFEIGPGADAAYAVVVQSTGRIVVAGEYEDGGSLDFAAVRFDEDGEVDEGFGFLGIAQIDIATAPGSEDRLRAMAVQPDDKLVLAGASDMGGLTPDFDFALVRLTASGHLDDFTSAKFGEDGKVTTSFATTGGRYDTANALAVQPDGRIVAAGTAQFPESGAGTGDDFAVARYRPDGSLDNFGPGAFGGDGQVTTAVAPSAAVDSALGVAIQPDGKVVVAGFSERASDGGSDISLVRYTRTGGLDGSFDLDGKLRHRPTPSSFLGGAIGVVPFGGKLIVGGGTSTSTSPPNIDLAAARYLQNDRDSDGRADGTDNCPGRPNFGQADVDRDGVGNVCDPVDNGVPTSGNDTLIGTAAADVLGGLAGNDTIRGLGAGDTLRGGTGRDTLVGGNGGDVLRGGKGKDVYRGGKGNDDLRAADGTKETVDCGGGKQDSATVDQADAVKGCESVKRKT